ncbi:hypothetical protein [Flavobacterium sp.]|uniref:hypothetical protein n=1 Tax=Flavobacterium sp. TaxID=239 RepID=UPI003C32CBE7
MEKNKINTEKIEEPKNKNNSSDMEYIDPKPSKEIETDITGNQLVVDRARNPIEHSEEIPNEIKLDNPNANRGVKTDKEAMKTVENNDLNSDVTSHRYPSSHPDNQEDRGNMKLDE